MEKIKQEVVDVLKRDAGLDDAAARRAVDAVINHFRSNPGRIAELMGLGGLGNLGGMFGGGGAAGPRPAGGQGGGGRHDGDTI